MSGQTSIAELELPDKMAHQRREWLVERAGWCLIALVLAAALLGALGPGLLGRQAESSDDGSLRVKYWFIERYEAPNVLELWLTSDSSTADHTLEFSRSFMDAVTIDQFVPRPASSTSQSGKVALTFHTETGSAEHKVICRYKHSRFGLLKYEIGLPGHQPLQVQQFVLP